MDLLTFLALAGIGLLAGFASAQNSTYWSGGQVFEDFMNSPLRILFPVAVAVVAGLELSGELSHRAIVNSRTREDIRVRLTRLFVVASARTFAVFAPLALVNAVAAFVVVPALWPHAVDPQGAGLMSTAAVQSADAAIAPLAGVLRFGWFPFAVVAAAWLGVNAVVFGLLTQICVILVHRPVVALLIPAVVYLAESIVLQYAGFPGPSFLISAIYPAGLQHYSLAEAIAPTAALAVGAFAASILLIRRSPTNPRMS